MLASNHEEDVSVAAHYLVNQGCKRIGCWTPSFVDPELQDDYIENEFKQTLLKLHAQIHPELFRRGPVSPASEKRAISLQEQEYILA